MATIPVNKTAALDLILGVTEMLDIYSYEDYALQSDNPQLSLSIDLRSALKHFMNTLDRFSSFPDFTRQVTNLLNSLYDGHTILAADCSGRISYDAFVPLAYFKHNSTTDPRVYVYPEYDQFLLDRKINDTAQFSRQRALAGAEVLTIDGIDTQVYLHDLLSNQNIIYGNIDPQTRWNQLFVNLRGHPTPRLGYGVALTSLARSWVESDEVRLSLLFNNGSTTDVSLPWLGLVDSEYHKVRSVLSYQDYYAQYVCMAGNSTDLLQLANGTRIGNVSSVPQQKGLSKSLRTSHKQQYLFDQEYSLVRAAPSPSLPSASASRERQGTNVTLPSSKTAAPGMSSRLHLIANVDSGFQIYHFLKTTVGVLYYTNFSSDEKDLGRMNQTETYYHLYTREMTRGLRELKARGVDTLLIDVSGNNGGATELGSYAMLSLFPSQYPGFATMLRSNAENLSFLDGSDEQTGFCRVNGSSFNSLDDWLSRDNRTLSVNGIDSSYTQLSVDDLVDNSNWHMIGNATFPSRNLFAPNDMLIISNGKCASTCAQVTMYYQDVHGIKSVGFGGKYNLAHELQTVGGVRGAQVVEMIDDEPADNMYNFTMRVSQMTMNFRTAVHYERRIPTEYVTRNVDYSYQHTRETYNSFEKTWSFVAEKHFNRAMSTMPMQTAIEPWKPLLEYPNGWFDKLLALQSSMHRPGEETFPKVLEM